MKKFFTYVHVNIQATDEVWAQVSKCWLNSPTINSTQWIFLHNRDCTHML